MKPRIGVVGAGWWSTQQHIPSLQAYELADLVAVADTDPARLAIAEEHFEGVTWYERGDDMFDSSELDGVIVAIPHAFHYEVCAAALSRGIHVLVEKPMTISPDDAWSLVDLAGARKLHLMIGATFQYTRLARRCREALQGGEIGELLHVTGYFASMVESYYRGRPTDYRSVFRFPVTGPDRATYADPAISGGGQAQTQLSHAMGMVMWATGRRADKVAAFMDKRDLAVDLVDSISYRLDNGALGTMGSTGSIAPGLPQQQGIHYYGTEGNIIQDLVGGKLEIHHNSGEIHIEQSLAPDEIYPAGLPGRRLADLIANRCDYNPAPGRDAARTVDFIHAAYRSAASSTFVDVADRGVETDSADSPVPCIHPQ